MEESAEANTFGSILHLSFREFIQRFLLEKVIQAEETKKIKIKNH